MNGQMIRGASGYANSSHDASVKYTEPQAPMSPIPGAIDRLHNSVMTLDNDLSTLHDRLHRVMRDAPPATVAGSGTVPQSPASQTFQQVSTLTDRVDRLSMFVREIMDRLEA